MDKNAESKEKVMNSENVNNLFEQIRQAYTQSVREFGSTMQDHSPALVGIMVGRVSAFAEITSIIKNWGENLEDKQKEAEPGK